MRPRLFLYKVTRNLMHETGDTGALLMGPILGDKGTGGFAPYEYVLKGHRN